jgi:hypothetical protein
VVAGLTGHKIVGRVVAGATELGLAVSRVVSEIGSAMNGHRRKLTRILSVVRATFSFTQGGESGRGRHGRRAGTSRIVLRACRFALDLTPSEVRDLDRTSCGAARFAYNWVFAQVKANIGQRAAERSYGIGGDDLTPALGWNLPPLRRAWKQAKNEVAPWWTECSKEAFNTSLTVWPAP